MSIKATTHSLDGIIGRLGVDPLMANRFLEQLLMTAKVVTYEQATEIVSVFCKNKLDTYYLAPDPHMPSSNIVLIVRDNMVITVMTKLTNALYGVEGEILGGTRMIRTLEGSLVEDNGWIKRRRQARKKTFKER